MTLTSFVCSFLIQIQSREIRIQWPSVVYCRMAARLTMRLARRTGIRIRELNKSKKNKNYFHGAQEMNLCVCVRVCVSMDEEPSRYCQKW